MTYQPNIPIGSTPLSVDYANIQNNFQQLDTIFDVDHITFSNVTAQKGYHQSVHLNPISTTTTNPPDNQPVVPPATTPGVGQIFSSQINDGINQDEALYYLTGGGRLMQLTRNIQPNNTSVANGKNRGYTFLPGGLLFQWGFVTGTTTGYTQLTFGSGQGTSNIPFTAALYTIQTTIAGANGSPPDSVAVVSIEHDTTSKTGFKWSLRPSGGLGNIVGFYWWAIGV